MNYTEYNLQITLNQRNVRQQGDSLFPYNLSLCCGALQFCVEKSQWIDVLLNLFCLIKDTFFVVTLS